MATFDLEKYSKTISSYDPDRLQEEYENIISKTVSTRKDLTYNKDVLKNESAVLQYKSSQNKTILLLDAKLEEMETTMVEKELALEELKVKKKEEILAKLKTEEEQEIEKAITAIRAKYSLKYNNADDDCERLLTNNKRSFEAIKKSISDLKLKRNVELKKEEEKMEKNMSRPAIIAKETVKTLEAKLEELGAKKQYIEQLRSKRR